METQEIKQLRATLEEELASIDRQLADYGTGAPGETFGVDSEEGFADSAQATAERSSLLGIVDQLQQNRREIVSALARMDDGTYGMCERCGRAIPFERLEAVPSTLLCVDCKQARAS